MKKFFALIVSLVMVVSLAGCNTPPKMGSGDKVIATSGSEKMYLRDYLYTLGSYKAQNESYIGQVMSLSAEEFEEYWAEESYVSPGFTMFDDLKDSAMGNAMEMAALYKLGKDSGFTYDEAELKELKDSLASSVLSLNSPEKTGERLFYEYYYVTIDEVCEVSKMISVIEQYEASIQESIVVSDSDVQAYYNDPANAAAIENLQEALVAHILVQIPEEITEEADKAEYKAKADDILARAQSGENFGQLAAEFSDDGGSKDNNGEYSVTRSTSFVPEFLEWTFSANVGDFDIVETDYGYHVMHLISLQGYDEMAESIKGTVIQEKYNETLSQILTDAAMEWTVDEDLLATIKYSVYGE